MAVVNAAASRVAPKIMAVASAASDNVRMSAVNNVAIAVAPGARPSGRDSEPAFLGPVIMAANV